MCLHVFQEAGRKHSLFLKPRLGTLEIGDPLRSMKTYSWSRKIFSSGWGSKFPSIVSTLLMTLSCTVIRQPPIIIHFIMLKAQFFSYLLSECGSVRALNIHFLQKYIWTHAFLLSPQDSEWLRLCWSVPSPSRPRLFLGRPFRLTERHPETETQTRQPFKKIILRKIHNSFVLIFVPNASI